MSKEPKAQEGKPANLLKLKWSTLRKIPYCWSPAHFKPIPPRANTPNLLFIATGSPLLLCLTSGCPNPGVVPRQRSWASLQTTARQWQPLLQGPLDINKLRLETLCIQFSTEWMDISFFSLLTSVLLIHFMWLRISLQLCITDWIRQTSWNRCRMVRWFAVQTHPQLFTKWQAFVPTCNKASDLQRKTCNFSSYTPSACTSSWWNFKVFHQ